MADESITVTIHGKENIEWLRAQVSEGRFTSESEGATECVAVWREDELEIETSRRATILAEFHADPSRIWADFRRSRRKFGALPPSSVKASHSAMLSTHANPSLVMTDDQVDQSLAEDRLERVHRAA